MEFQHTNLWGKVSKISYQNTGTMKPSFMVYQEDKLYKELPTENFFLEPQGEFCDLSCHSPLCMTEKIHFFHMLNVGNVTLKKLAWDIKITV